MIVRMRVVDGGGLPLDLSGSGTGDGTGILVVSDTGRTLLFPFDEPDNVFCEVNCVGEDAGIPIGTYSPVNGSSALSGDAIRLCAKPFINDWLAPPGEREGDGDGDGDGDGGN